ncbi:MAG TPA: NIPSNAP family protein [Chryseolinea sp.]|nr:NIPSNAP family protein [Chryseolinea sp.]
MKYILLLIVTVLAVVSVDAAPKREYYEIRIYYFKDKAQEERIDKYLKEAFIPALHRASVSHVGVFKPVETDTTYGKRIYVFIPYSSLDQYTKVPEALQKDKQYDTAGAGYLDAPYDNPPYTRIQSILLQAFPGMPQHETPKLKSAPAQRVYELRSYESHTEKISKNKIKMFNDGDEVGLFKRLGFNAVFYAEVLSGSRMPNLMYMTTFDDQASRDAHWKSFTEDAQWKTLKDMPEYQHNVSKNEITFLRPTDYSEI